MFAYRVMIIGWSVTSFFASSLCVTSDGWGDEFLLSGGGRIEGKWENRTSRGATYEVVTSKGIRIRLKKSNVQERNIQRSAVQQYHRIQPTYKDTITDQWIIAQWCRENRLARQRARHLHRILQLDPDHFGARQALGFHFIDGRWITREAFRKRNGYHRHQGRWVVSQELDLKKENDQIREIQRKWFAKLRRLRDDLGTERGAAAAQEIQSVRDPLALKALLRSLKNEQNAGIRRLYVDALGAIGGVTAWKHLVQQSLVDPDIEVFYRCLDYLSKAQHPDVTDAYVQALRHSNNATVNRAAIALRHLGDRSAISALINSLLTTHEIKLDSPGRVGAMTATFTSQRGGASAPAPLGFGRSGGKRPKSIYQRVQNLEVLNALVRLSGGASYGFDQQAWKFWHAVEMRRATDE